VQIATAVRQAETFDEEKRRVRSAEALYRMSRELSKYRTPREIAEHAFPILQEEFSLKRIWFGVLNEQSTHIAGKAGVGPGMRRQVQEIQIELSLRHDFLDEAIRTQKPVVVPEGAKAECSGLNRIMGRLSAGTFMIYPLISLNQVIGILVLEPEMPATFFTETRLQLLAGMAGEMASVLLARRFESKMAEAGKMRMAGLLASGVAHNFNNLLQAILGQVALIEMNLPKGSQATSYTKSISDAAQRGARLVSQLLNFSLPGPASKIPLKVDLMLRSSLELYRSLVGPNVGLTLTLEPQDAAVVGDHGQLQQAITNLLVNAKDAIGQRGDGTVEITLKRVAVESGEVDPELSPGQYVRIDVRDNGEGMNPEQQARCFEPFFTTKNVDRLSGVGMSGSGLGLSSAYSIIRQHDGIITIHSQAKEGTTVSIYLPLHEAAAQRAGPETSTRPTAAGSGVLVLGLEPGVLPFTASLFSSLGYRTKSVFDAQQLVDLLRRAPDRWTGVLLDLDRLDEDASKIAAQLAKEFPEVGVFCASAVPKEWSERLPSVENIELMDKPLGVWAVSSALLRLQERRNSRASPPSPLQNIREKVTAP
jgi:signal transduction histidine kinase